MKRLTFTPDELASGLDSLQRTGQVGGMFLSSNLSSCCGNIPTMDDLIRWLLRIVGKLPSKLLSTRRIYVEPS